MTDTSLAQLSNLSVYSAMAVLTIAMISYAVFLARTAAAVPEPRRQDRALVAAGTWRDGSTTTQSRSTGDSCAPTASEPLSARKAASIARSLTVLGTLLTVGGVGLRAWEVHRWPLGNMYEFAIVGCSFTLLAYLAWSSRRDLRWLGLFVVAPVLLTLGLAISVWYTDASELMPSLRSVWLAIHVSVATLSVALFTIGCSLAVLYLVQSRIEIARTRPRSFMDRLPGSADLERLTHAVHMVAFPLWTFTLIAGAIWARQAWGAYWQWDPKEVWTFVIWTVYAAYMHARTTTGINRQKATGIALAGFVCIILNYTVVNMYIVGMHSYSGL